MNFYNLAFWFLFLFPFSSPVPDVNPLLSKSTTVAPNLVFKSSDGGEIWKNISAGLPLQGYDYERNSFFVNENGLYLRDGIGIYHDKASAKSAAWEKEIFPTNQRNLASCRSGVFAYNNQGQFLQKTTGSTKWLAVYSGFKPASVNTVFETKAGAVLVGTDYGLYRSADQGKNWKHISIDGSWIIKMVESEGVILATSGGGIIRSTDDGNSWDRVLYEGGVGIDVEPIKGGFAAIAANTSLQARTVRASYDGGKTWQPIDAGLTPDLRTSSIVQLGNAFYCGHPDGIFKSSDKGKTWKLLFASVDGKVFNLFVSGNVLYAIPRSGGC